MKKTILLIISTCLLLLGGCTWLRENPEFTKNIINIGLRVAIYALIQKEPGIAPHVMDVANVMEDPESALSPDALDARLSQLINNSTSNPLYTQSLNDLKYMIMEFYSDVYDKNRGVIKDSQLADIVRAMGKSMKSAINPNTVQSAPFVIETQTSIITVE